MQAMEQYVNFLYVGNMWMTYCTFAKWAACIGKHTEWAIFYPIMQHAQLSISSEMNESEALYRDLLPKVKTFKKEYKC